MRIKKFYKNFKIDFFDVSENKIQKARALFMGAGANICPQSAVALDAVLQARGKRIIKKKDLVVSISTASSVKFADSGLKHHLKGQSKDLANKPKIVKGTIENIEKAIGSGIA